MKIDVRPSVKNLEPYSHPHRPGFLPPDTAVPNKIALDELNPPLGQLQGQALYWTKKSIELNFAWEDEADEDTLIRILWHSMRGYDTPYPGRSVSNHPKDR